jgi:hypothetical protein
MLKEVTQKIIDLLKLDNELGVPEENYFFGPPFTRNKTPFCYVSWAGGPVKIETLEEEVWIHDWHIVIVEIAKEDDLAEQSVLDKAERAKEVLKQDHTLGGLVRDSLVTSLEGEVMTVDTDFGKITQIIAGARLVLHCEVTKPV